MPPDKNLWAHKATVHKSSQCRGFVGYGDAHPGNISPLIFNHAEIRMAEACAVNRAPRKAYGIARCSLEELPPWAIDPKQIPVLCRSLQGRSAFQKDAAQANQGLKGSMTQAKESRRSKACIESASPASSPAGTPLSPAGEPPSSSLNLRPLPAAMCVRASLEISALDVGLGDFEKHAGKPDEWEKDDVEIASTYNDSRKVRRFSFDAEFMPQGELTEPLLSSAGN